MKFNFSEQTLILKFEMKYEKLPYFLEWYDKVTANSQRIEERIYRWPYDPDRLSKE